MNAFAALDIPADAITLLVLLTISLAGWVKKKFFSKEEPPLMQEDDPWREVIWREQVGEEQEPEDEGYFGERPRPFRPDSIRFDKPKPPPLQPALKQAEVPVVSRKEAELANAFEQSTNRRKRNRTSHRRTVDRMLRSPSAAKNAILLTEILGPPVALKPHGEGRP